MANRTKETFNRLDDLLPAGDYTQQLPFSAATSYAIFSDLHLGDGTASDNFAHNKDAFHQALAYYKDHDYKVILVGDTEELWQFDLAEIWSCYKTSIYKQFQAFPAGSVVRIHGNHDHEWRGIFDPAVGEEAHYRWASEAVRIGDHILLVHGHQGEALCDKSTWLSSFVARLFRYIEPAARFFGFEDKSATKSQVPKDRELDYYRWAKKKKTILICGHTHRALFASHSYSHWLKQEVEKARQEVREIPTENVEAREKAIARLVMLEDRLEHEQARGREVERLEGDGDPLPCYFNCGCGGYREGVTNLEIEGGAIRLVKWGNDWTVPKSQRRELYAEGDLQKFIEVVTGSGPGRTWDFVSRPGAENETVFSFAAA